MNLNVSVFKSNVMLSREDFTALCNRAGLVTGLRQRLLDEHMLLLTALHELAVSESKEPLHFTRRWLHEKRREPELVPVHTSTTSPGREEGGEARVGA